MEKSYSKRFGGSLLFIILMIGLFSSCQKEPTGKKTVVSLLYLKDFKHLEQLAEDRYPEIDLQIERTPYTSELLRRLKKGVGPDLIISTEPSTKKILPYLLDISDTPAATAYEGNIYQSDLGMYFIGCMVPDFLGKIEGVQWLSDFVDKQSTLSGIWEKSFHMVDELVDNGLLDSAALSNQRNSIHYQTRMVDGTLAAVFGNSSLYSECQTGNAEAVKKGTAREYSYRMLPLLSDQGNDPWFLFSPLSYIGINDAIDDEKKEACRKVLELMSTEEGQTAVIEDFQMGVSCLKGQDVKDEHVPLGVEEYLESGYIYNVFFPDQVIDYLGSNARKVLGEKMTVSEALNTVDEHYYDGSEQADYDLSVIGTMKQDMVLQNMNVRTGETEIGNFLADCVAEVSETSIAVVNGGGIRGSFYKGDVYGEDLAAVSPYDNLIVVLEMDGQTVWDMLENGVSLCTDEFPGGRFLQISGLKYVFDSSMPAGKRIKEVTLPDGSPLKLDSNYKVAVNDYMAGRQGYAEGNGDDYTMLNFYSDDVKKENVSLVKETNLTYRDAIASFFEKHQDNPASAKIEGRIIDQAKK